MKNALLQQLHAFERRRFDGDDLVIVAMGDEHRDIDPLQILGVIDLREFVDAIELAFDAAHKALQPKTLALTFAYLRAWPIVAIKRHGQILIELRPIITRAGADAIERFDGRAFRVGWRFQHERRHGTEQHGLRRA